MAAAVAAAGAAIRRAVRAARRHAGGHRGRGRPKRGSARRAASSDVVLFAVGDHAIGGIVRGGAPITGARGRAGSVGWLSLNPVEREDYRKVGCVEAEVAAAGIVRRMIWRIKAGDRSRVQDAVERRSRPRSPSTTSSSAARASDGVSISVVRDTAKYLGMAAANLVVVADPEMLVLGGIMASAADLLLEPIRTELARRLPKAMMDALAIETATLGDDAAGDRRGAAGGRGRCDDRAVGRVAGAARPHPLARHADDRRRAHRRDPARRAVGQPPATRISPSTVTTSSPASSTSTCTASRGSTRSIAAGRRRSGRGDRRAAAAIRRHRVLPDDRRVRAAGAAARARPGAARARSAGRRAPRGCCRRISRATSSIREYAGAQPSGCLRSPRAALGSGGAGRAGGAGSAKASAERRLDAEREDFDGAEILAEIERAAPDVGIVTLAPELDGGLDLIRWLAARGQRVSLGHSAATYDEALAAIAAGARHATHLFNRMPPLGHRAPGLAGAVLQTDEVAAEIICDGFHVHPALIRTAIAAKRPSRILAITDATAVAGLPAGARAALGGQPIIAGESTALLADGHDRRQPPDDGPRVRDAGRPGGHFARRRRHDLRDDAGARARPGRPRRPGP